jgi:hypothetical protein
VGVVAFATTNIDDTLLLAAFFAGSRGRARAVVRKPAVAAAGD